MNREEIINKIKNIIKKFYDEDKILLAYNTPKKIICERTISARMAMYAQYEFKDYDVDCEYNRYINEVKRIDNKNIYPDIIIHRRKENKNLVWIEIKKKDSSKSAIEKDKIKLRKVTSIDYGYNYNLGILIVLSDKIDETYFEVFEEGKFKYKDI